MNQLEDDPAVVGVLTGMGGVFSAGSDLRDALHNSPSAAAHTA
jgi:enoyl-CoA hydratase/carnithine racemase